MKTKPWSLIVLALLHVLAPVGNLLFNAFRSGRSLSAQWHYWFDVLPKGLLLIYVGIPVLAGVFIFICRRWSYWAYLVCLAVVFMSNLYSFYTSANIATFVALMAVLLIDLFIVAYFVVPSVQKVYFDPRMRWWEAAPRYHFSQEAVVNGKKASIKNLSQGGMFLSVGPDLKENDRIEASWEYDGQTSKVQGVVAYRSPAGIGIRFEHSGESQRQVKSVIEKLHKNDQIVKERLPGPEDSFGVWLKKLVTKREGLFPKMKS